jgi:hypothetical protein
MTQDADLQDGARYKKLGESLARSPMVTRFDEGEDLEAWPLAHAFLDLEKSFRRFVDAQLPGLFDPSLAVDDISDKLLDIGEEFRHIVYHLKDPRFYRYITDQH